MSISMHEHFAFQEAQSQAFVAGKLTLEEAALVYEALGEIHTDLNDGWAAGTDLATKVVVFQLMGELLWSRHPGS